MATLARRRWWVRSPSARDLDAAGDALIEDARARAAREPAARDRLATLAVASAFFVAAVALSLASPSERSPSSLTALLLVAAYAVAQRVEFEVGTGFALPTQLVLVPMLFVLPVGTVPLWVALGLMLGRLVDRPGKRLRLEQVPLLLGSSWHALGPATVLAAAGEPNPAWGDWPLYLAALAAQLALDFGSSALREWLGLGISPLTRIRFMAWAYLVDVALAPVGFLLAAASTDVPYAFVLAMPLVGLLAVFARERRVRIDHALELGNAYRGTAFLLGDVVEADDAYTGSHSRDVVGLSVSVAEELGLDAQTRRNAEFVALLHDVGKIRIPGEILNKAGPLTSDEQAVIRTHTIEGQRMLEQVGGLLGDVGRVVRSCHERWDGTGYPDGLAGKEIPLVGRIVACCDAFSAMTTDRSYRAALPLHEAMNELEANAGTQFDPAVVAALVSVIERDAARRPD